MSSLQHPEQGTVPGAISHSGHFANNRITLSPREAQLRGLLLDVSRYIDESKEIREPIILRFAGGWVRDKLLGIPSHDIDTAINAMTGYTFSLKMQEYLRIPENLRKHGLDIKDVGNLHKIAANPEKSKHLETVTTKLLDFDLDFVNLRKETYSAESRNPQMEFGTAMEDALRRDATVNALFYNLHTDEVEDFSSGLSDLQNRLIRTPLDPYQTFMDDPLRVLRLIRFASRLNFTIDPRSEAVMGNEDIREALKIKISRERVGIEVEKMFKAQDPRSALIFFDRLGLYSTIFTDPASKNIPQPSTSRWHRAYDCLELMRSNRSPGAVYDSLVGSDGSADIAWVLVALTPWAMISTPSSGKPGGKPALPLATLVAREGIKANNRVCDIITGAVRHRDDIEKVKDAIISGESWVTERDVLGMKIRKWDTQGGHWKLHVLLAIFVDAMQSDGDDGFASLLSTWQQVIDHLQEMDVFDAPSWKRLIDGTTLARALDVKPGKWMAAALDVCMAWQFRNPKATDPMGAIEEVKAKAEELEIPIKK